jgi:hypothetical protein
VKKQLNSMFSGEVKQLEAKEVNQKKLDEGAGHISENVTAVVEIGRECVVMICVGDVFVSCRM